MTDQMENVAEQTPAEDPVQPQETIQEPVEISSQSEESEVESDKDHNFRELRESKKQTDRENEELKARVAQLEQPKVEEAPAQFEIGEDDLVEGRHLKQVVKEIKTYFKQKEEETIPDRLKSKFQDFDSVVSKENIEKLKKAEPELFSSITASNDLYTRGVLAYKTLKALGLAKEDPYVADKEKVHNTHSRPVSAQAVKGQGALAEANAFANGLTPALKDQLRKEMEEAARAY